VDPPTLKTQFIGVMQKSEDKSSVSLYTDGASRGNPGESGIGFIIKKDGKTFIKGCYYTGKCTNNFAEYLAFLTGLKEALKLFELENIKCYSDSLLLVNQISGKFQIKNKKIIKLCSIISSLCDIQKINVNYIPRDKNKEADALANKGINEKIKLPEHINSYLS
jgi:ribonuclease HI